MKIGNKEFDITPGKLYIMGILNVTPDSFSDGGKYLEEKESLRHVEEMINAGADIIDIGGESTRPGYQKISEEEEIERVCKSIELIKGTFDIPISVDTYKDRVMEASLSAGADMANDIWGFRYGVFNDSVSHMADIVSRYNVPVVLMHNDNLGRDIASRESRIREYASINGLDLAEAEKECSEEQIVYRVIRGLKDSVRIALESGVAEDKIILDPGVGFAKTYRENLLTIKGLDEMAEKLEYPLLLGTSRKSVIGEALGLPVSDREEGTLVTTVLAQKCGCSFVRVHDVEKNKRAIKMYEAIFNS